MTTPPTLVLDLDGTLVDTAPDLLATLNAVLACERLPPVTLDQVRAMTGAGARALLERGMAAAGVSAAPERMDALFASFIDHYAAHIADHSQPFPGALESLQRFSDAGWRLAICTNKLEGLARLLLDALELTPCFAAICGGDTFAFRKPHPGHILETVRLAGGDPALAVMVGDSAADINAARAGGVPVVGMTFGYTDIPVAELNPDVVLDHFDGLYDAAASLLPTRLQAAGG